MYLFTLKSLSKNPNKFLVGKSRCVYEAFTHHNHPAVLCEYSKLYSPWVLLRAEEMVPHTHFSLLVYTLYTMKLMGVDNVRGGPWRKPVLSSDELVAIQHMIDCEKLTGTRRLQ